MEWKEIISVPSRRSVEVAVIDKTGIHPLGFPCHYKDGVWVNANTHKRIEINPTHWREWDSKPQHT